MTAELPSISDNPDQRSLLMHVVAGTVKCAAMIWKEDPELEAVRQASKIPGDLGRFIIRRFNEHDQGEIDEGEKGELELGTDMYYWLADESECEEPADEYTKVVLSLTESVPLHPEDARILLENLPHSILDYTATSR